MKKLLFLAAASLTLFACESKDELSKPQEYVKATFSAEAPVLDMDVAIGTKADEGTPRMIACYFPSAKGTQKFYVEENEKIEVLLPASVESKGYFAYLEGYSEHDYYYDWDGSAHDKLTLSQAKGIEAYNAVWTGFPEETGNKEVCLTRTVSMFTLDQGSIPEGYYLKHSTQVYLWYNYRVPAVNGSLNDLMYLGNYPSLLTESPTFTSFSEGKEIPVTIYVISEKDTEVASAGEVIYQHTFKVSAERNEHKTVVFNTSLSFGTSLSAVICDVEMITTTETINIDNTID